MFPTILQSSILCHLLHCSFPKLYSAAKSKQSCHKRARLIYRLFRLPIGSLLLSKSILALPFKPCIQECVPEGEEWLGEIGLDAPGLVVDIVVLGVITSNELEGIPGEGVSAVVINGLDGGEGEEACALTKGHAGGLKGNAGAKGVKKEALKRMVVKGTVGVWDVEAVMSRVEGCYDD